MNSAILLILGLQMCLSLIAAVTGANLQLHSITNTKEYFSDGSTMVTLIPQLFGTFIILLTNFVPISLVTTYELVQFW
jgi:hypothetical protein